MGGIISAWNMRVVGDLARVVIARAMSSEETAGNSSTFSTILVEVRRSGEGTYSAFNEEALEAADTCFHKGEQFMGIPWNYPTIEPNINPTLSLCSLDLLLQPRDCCSRRNGIQWHINDRGHSARSSSPCASIEALPFSSARFVQMYVCVDQPWE